MVLYHLFMAIWGMVDDCFNHMKLDYLIKLYWMWFFTNKWLNHHLSGDFFSECGSSLPILDTWQKISFLAGECGHFHW